MGYPNDTGGSDTIGRRLDLLADRRRRELCRYLHTTDRSEFTPSELAEQLAPEEDVGSGGVEGNERNERNERNGGEPHPDGIATLERNLRHVHLPKFDDAGVIEYDPRAGRLVTNDRRVASLFDVLETVTERVEDAASDAGSDAGTAAE
ncbi:hypothetical protein SAMN05444422_11084 [Halobiforma haloterrestris]|uniref:DUF7344 domain-containing protein n=1 Tax=Natronobacterium haloterrestre TaxID=148448 RepID=A0A1I1K3P4_NATHA|nr:hypothetical protein [Halobiforma haloterrestris]SFC55346.1 hypothetical protein SAMN05444422_11084 [Halobiforma haloterrestris]